MKLVASIARGRRWLDELIADPTANTESIAGREGCSVRKVNMTISLAFLAPDLVKAAIDGRFPHGMGVAPPLRPSGRMVSSAPDAWAGRAVTFQSNRASELSNGPRPGVVLHCAHEPRRHSRHAHADASRSGILPAVKSAQCPPGYIVSGGYCTPMFRPAPGLRGPPFPGNGISRPETKAPKLPL
jgi:hypothetical protein